MTHFARHILLAVERYAPPALFRGDRWSRVAVTCVNAILVIALARALAGLTLAILIGPSLPPVPSSALTEFPSGSDASAPPRPAEDAVISAWHLFGQAEAGRPVETPSVPLPATSLKLRLVGIFFMEQGSDRALALIAEDNGLERGYRPGEPLPGGARLQRIQRDHVVISRNGREEALKLPKLGDGLPETAPPRAPEPTMEPMAEPAASGEPRVIDAGAVAERLRGDMMTQPRALEDIAFASPYLQDGQFIGFRLREGRDPRLLGQLGLSGGDVVTEINGSRLNSPIQGLTLLREVLGADRVNVRVLRGGVEIPLTFSLDGRPR
ncbi:MAG: type II secretion system protein N [Candidatus Contendobacter sp.]|nr:type II secretion system protein N [Candidatus Contendobacter sp.]MDG4556600.1 type II secretion system protein N [Candidatus Contendobacter sp.]